MNWLFNRIPSHFERHATMFESNDSSGDDPIAESSSGLNTPREALTEILRAGAQKMLAAAIDQEVASDVAARSGLVNESGHRLVVRNGFLPEREIMTGIGKVPVMQPRVRDKRSPEQREFFTPAVLPKYLRRTKSMEELIPWLYLKGISTNDFPEALQSLLGAGAKGLSASTITRLKSVWEDEYAEWSKRSLTGKRYVYLWADGIYCNVRLEDDRQCLLVLMGATADGTKELIAVVDGVRESELSWKEVLLDLKSRGLEDAPELAIGDGALGFWKALREVFPTTREQRCTVHKTANVLNKLPRSLQPQAKRLLHDLCCTTSGRRRRGPKLTKLSTCFSTRSMPGPFKPPSVWRKTATNCSRSTTSRRRTGVTSERRIRSKARSPRSDSDSARPEAAVLQKRL